MNTLAADFKKFAEQAKERLAEQQKNMAKEAAERLVYFSPIWTGAYVKSMRCGIGVPDMSHEPASSGMQPYPPRLDEVSAEMIRMETTTKLKTEIDMAPAGKTIYLSNNIPYANHVEYIGWFITPDGIEYVAAGHQVFANTIMDLEAL
jgi:hypothetical protein